MTNPLLARLSDGVHRVRLDDGRSAVVKVGRDAPAGFFAAEARGLAALRGADALRVPDVYEIASDAIVIEDLGSGHATRDDRRRAGVNLARVHALQGSAFGFDDDGWCGDSPLDNTPSHDGNAFFAERRLLAQGCRARASGLIDDHDTKSLDHLCARLGDLVPAMPPVLIHGDLWTQNLHACANGELALIDAGAVHYGWAEADLAMLTLFGQPPQDFFDAYEATGDVDRNWRERAPIYNLYHLLNHLNLFGSGYLGGVRAVLRRYA